MSRCKSNLLAALFWVISTTLALAAGSNVNSMTASGAIVGTQLFYCPTGATADLKCTAAQIAAYNYSLMSGDCTTTGTGTITCTKTNGVAFTGLATVAGVTAGDLAIYNGSNWVRCAGNNTGTQFLTENASGACSWSSGVSAGVSSFSTTCPTSGPSTGAVTFNNLQNIIPETGNYTSTASDCNSIIKFTLTGSATYTLPAASNGFSLNGVTNVPSSTNALVIQPPSGSICAGSCASTYSLSIGKTVAIYSDGTNYYVSDSSNGSMPPGNTGYVTNRWYPNFTGFGPSGGAQLGAGTVNCTPYEVYAPGMTAKAIGVSVSTADTTPNYTSLAIYSVGSNGYPNSLIDSTSEGITLASTGGISAALANGTDVLSPGLYFACEAMNSTTGILTGLSLGGGGAYIGATTVGNALGNTVTLIGLTCVAGAPGCGPTWASGAGSAYTWVASLATASWTQKIVGGQTTAFVLESN